MNEQPEIWLEILISNPPHPLSSVAVVLGFGTVLAFIWPVLAPSRMYFRGTGFPVYPSQIRAAPVCVNMNRQVSDSLDILLNKCTGYRTGWTKLSWPLANKTRLWLSFWHERKKGGILLRHAQWEAFSKETSEGPTRWTLGRHLKLSHIYFPSSPPPFPLPGTWFTSSLLAYKVAVQSAEAAMETHTCRWEHRGWHSARAGCCRKAPLSLRPGCKARSMGVSLLYPLSMLSIEGSLPDQACLHIWAEWKGTLHHVLMPTSCQQDIPWAGCGMSYLSRLPRVLVLCNEGSRREGERSRRKALYWIQWNLGLI